jgi:rhodanese-related sulfurtransferase
MRDLFLVVAWDEGSDKKVVTLCKTEEIAQEVKKSYKHSGYENVKIHELPVYEDFHGIDSWEI